MAIGIIDSGLGGYRIYHSLHQEYQDSAFVFLADQKNAPYGNKTQAEIINIASRNMTWFKSIGITTIVVACNTMNAVALTHLKQTFSDMTFIDVIEPTLNELKGTNIQDWLVVATKLTTQSRMYEKELLKRFPSANIRNVALPHLVSLIEGLASQDEMTQNIQSVLTQEDLNQKGLILGCTHYPLALNSFKAVFKGAIYDSEQAMVHALAQVHQEKGPSKCLTTGDANHAIAQVNALFQEDEVFTQVVI